MRSFTVVHISDLHITGSEQSELQVLTSGITSALNDLKHAIRKYDEMVQQFDKSAPDTDEDRVPRILVVTGDVVDSPTEPALQAAKAYLGELSKYFSYTLIVPGNHDVKRFFGNFSRSEDFNKYFNASPNILIQGAGLHLIGIDSTPASWARGSVEQNSFDQMVLEMYRAEAIPEAERLGLVRIVALHHHPVPLLEGEGEKYFGADAENFAYLQRPARFLAACNSIGVSIILHGHRHGMGLRRFSVLAEGGSGIYDDSYWKNLYVLACPSSTGKGSDAGFNVLRMSDDAHYVDVIRYNRAGNRGKFEPFDKGFPNEKLRLFLSRLIQRDVAIDVEAQLSVFDMSSTAPEQALFPLVSRLFRRRAFYYELERHWGYLLYAIVMTRIVWEQNVIPRLRRKRLDAAGVVLRSLLSMEDFLSDDVLELSKSELTDITSRFIHDKKAFVSQLPQVFISHHDERSQDIENKRSVMLIELAAGLERMGISIENMGGQYDRGGLEE
jgi:Icc protein